MSIKNFQKIVEWSSLKHLRAVLSSNAWRDRLIGRFFADSIVINMDDSKLQVKKQDGVLFLSPLHLQVLGVHEHLEGEE